jgi:hypothetical protein
VIDGPRTDRSSVFKHLRVTRKFPGQTSALDNLATSGIPGGDPMYNVLQYSTRDDMTDELSNDLSSLSEETFNVEAVWRRRIMGS